MKQRNGFVSNSSSSSFVCLGVPLNVKEIVKDMTDEQEDEYMDDLYSNYEVLSPGDDVKGECHIIMEGLAWGDECGFMDDGSYSLPELNELAEKFAKKHNVEVSAIKLYHGTRACQEYKMKQRNGFVSNSSSSSFVIVMTPEQDTAWKKELNVYELQVVEGQDTYLGREKGNIAGTDVIVYSGMTGNYCFYEDMSITLTPEDQALFDADEDDFCKKYGLDYWEGDAGEFWYSAEGKLPKDIFQTSIDC